jgi:hypothetical protein
MRSESLSSKDALNRNPAGNVAASIAVQLFNEAEKMGWQLVRVRPQRGTQPFADLGADRTVVVAIDLNTAWNLAGHGGAVCCDSI